MLLGDWLDGSGWTSALVAAEVAAGGVADSFIKATHIIRTRRAHQVTDACLFILQSKAYSDYHEIFENGEEPLQFTDWADKMSKDRPQSLYWNRVLFLELCALQLIRAIREGNFSLYKKSLVSLVDPWMFSLDHINDARWMSIGIRDMSLLFASHPDIHQELTNGSFVVLKTEKVFSSVALDHAQDQVNARLKGKAVGLTENPAALRRWMIVGSDLKSQATSRNSRKHLPKKLVKKGATIMSKLRAFGLPLRRTCCHLCQQLKKWGIRLRRIAQTFLS